MLKKLSISKKLIAAFLLVTLLASTSGVVGVFLMRSIDAQYSDALVNYGFAQGDIGKCLAAFCRVDGSLHDAIGYTNETNMTEAQLDFEDQSPQIQPYLVAIEKSLHSDEARGHLKTATNAWTQYQAKAVELMAEGNTTDRIATARVQERLVSELDPLYMEFYTSLSAILDDKVERGNLLSTSLSATSAASIAAASVIVVVAVALSIAIAFGIAGLISRPIRACAERLEKLAKGDLDAEVPVVKSQDETGVLAGSTKVIVDSLSSVVGDVEHCLGSMAGGDFSVRSKAPEAYVGDFLPILHSMRQIGGKMSDTLREISQAADLVSSGSDQVAGGAQSLSQGATEQASSVEELAASLTELSDHVQANAANAQEASAISASVGDRMEESNQEMREMISAMTRISDSSKEIGKIIDTIENIAFQTNILALNAAVEAARAGTAGKGFAVVADEVRNLANKSQEASKNTATLIARSLEAVASGSQIADKTAETLLHAVEGAKQTSEKIGQISEASAEQANAISQISEGVDQISSVVQTTSATSEESAATSEELSGQARLLKDLVSRFRLREGGETAGA